MAEAIQNLIEPPPRSTGDARVDGVSGLQYLWALYTKGILNGTLLQTQNLAAAIEDDASTIASLLNHNDTKLKQGGAASEYFHLTQAEYTGTGTGVFVRRQDPVLLGLLDAQSIKAQKTIQVTGSAAPSSGAGIELSYSGGGVILAYDRDANTFKDLQLSGSVITLYTGPAATPYSNLQLVNSGGADVNFVSISSNTTTNGPIITASGETNVTLHVRSKGTGNVVIGADGNPIAQFTGGAGTKYLTIGNSSNDATLSASSGGINVGTTLFATATAAMTAGAGLLLQYDTGGASGQVIAYDITGDVYKGLQLAGSVITLYTGPNAAGTYTNLQLTNSGGTDVNFVSISSNITANGPVITASGSDANVGLNMRGKGTGTVIVQKPFFTNVQAYAAGSLYLVMDATGNVQISTLGPGA